MKPSFTDSCFGKRAQTDRQVSCYISIDLCVNTGLLSACVHVDKTSTGSCIFYMIAYYCEDNGLNWADPGLKEKLLKP